MTQHAIAVRGESEGMWLPLTEYSVQSGISLSTIRRKIKSNSIPYRLERGRYLILYREEKVSDWSLSSSPANEAETETLIPSIRGPIHQAPTHLPIAEITSQVQAGAPFEEALQMIGDAFEHAIREKDERIQLLEHHADALEERVSELKILVKVLEEKYSVRY